MRDWDGGGGRSFADVVNIVMMQGRDGLRSCRISRKRHSQFPPDQSEASPTKRTSVRGGTVEGVAPGVAHAVQPVGERTDEVRWCGCMNVIRISFDVSRLEGGKFSFFGYMKTVVY